MVATKPVDLRKGIEGLATLVRESIRADPFSGAVYVFRAKRVDRIKLAIWDETGLCLFTKRLEDGIFRWPKIEDWRGSSGGLCTRHGKRRRQRKQDSCWPRCGEVNQERRPRRQMAANMF
ncbi:IS66 family insertion sequence element accessory protein TnpB [Bradyrhizobium diazoefficiens]|nr:IS66 family insertion sequence element accessory protein TnpB [Bradyrhizobium diazoefficiens]QQN65438.1 IS66 family insertion sequence element accessory protein TnpB [Bradyrhizobium diazoefficiens]